jgi:hypothetical protein
LEAEEPQVAPSRHYGTWKDFPDGLGQIGCTVEDGGNPVDWGVPDYARWPGRRRS